MPKSTGNEVARLVLLGLALDHPHGAAAVYYRSRPFLFASGQNLDEAPAGPMAKAGSPTGGGMPHVMSAGLLVGGVRVCLPLVRKN